MYIVGARLQSQLLEGRGSRVVHLREPGIYIEFKSILSYIARPLYQKKLTSYHREKKSAMNLDEAICKILVGNKARWQVQICTCSLLRLKGVTQTPTQTSTAWNKCPISLYMSCFNVSMAGDVLCASYFHLESKKAPSQPTWTPQPSNSRSVLTPPLSPKV